MHASCLGLLEHVEELPSPKVEASHGLAEFSVHRYNDNKEEQLKASHAQEPATASYEPAFTFNSL